MMGNVSPLRVLLKAVVLFTAFNILFASLNVAAGRMTAYNSLFPGRLRFPYEQEPSLYSVGYNAPIFEDFDAMFGSHVISAGEKPADEFRLVLLGDSATWGGHLPAGENLAEQINRLALQTCDGRRVRAYNLAFPWPFSFRDLLILDEAMKYRPDTILWMVTLSTFDRQNVELEFLRPHAERALRLIDRYDLDLPWLTRRLDSPSFWDRTLVGQRARLNKIVRTQLYGLLWAATGIDFHVTRVPINPQPPSPDVRRDAAYFGFSSSQSLPRLLDTLTLSDITAAVQIAADVPLIVVNEPIFIATGGNSDLRYNNNYPRWAYDAYRETIAEYASARGYEFYDFWNTIPANEFLNPALHRSPAGERRFAEILVPVIAQAACPLQP